MITKICLIFVLVCLVDLILYSVGINTQLYTRSNYYKEQISSEDLKNYGYREDEDYVSQIRDGREHVGNKRCLFLTLCRDISGAISTSCRNIEHMGSQFEDYRVIVFENDSVDDSREKLKEWEVINSHVTLLECSDLGSRECKLSRKHPKREYGALGHGRISVLTEYRNYCLDYVKKNYPDWDYVVVYDMDMRGGIHLDGFLQTFHNSQDWDVIAARGIKPIPLTWGYCNMIFDSMAFEEIGTTGEQTNYIYNFLKQQVYSKKLGSPYIPVASAFNGLTVYKMLDLVTSGARYEATNCEHVSFHRNLRTKGYNRMFINPSLIIQNGLDNETQLPLWTFLSWFRK